MALFSNNENIALPMYERHHLPGIVDVFPLRIKRMTNCAGQERLWAKQLHCIVRSVCHTVWQQCKTASATDGTLGISRLAWHRQSRIIPSKEKRQPAEERRTNRVGHPEELPFASRMKTQLINHLQWRFSTLGVSFPSLDFCQCHVHCIRWSAVKLKWSKQ